MQWLLYLLQCFSETKNNGIKLQTFNKELDEQILSDGGHYKLGQCTTQLFYIA